MSAVSTPTYKVATLFLLFTSKFMTSDEYAVKDSFLFAEKPVEQDSEFLIWNVDGDSLFINMSLKENIDMYTNTLF